MTRLTFSDSFFTHYERVWGWFDRYGVGDVQQDLLEATLTAIRAHPRIGHTPHEYAALPVNLRVRDLEYAVPHSKFRVFYQVMADGEVYVTLVMGVREDVGKFL